MTFDGFNAAVLIEPTQASSLPLPPEAAEGPTLQDALAVNRDALAPDLWQSRAGDNGSSSLGDIVATHLRPLNPDEMLLLAGSNATVTGDPWDYWDPWEWPGGPPNDPGDQYPGGSGGGGQPPEPEAEPTPCVEASPAGIPLQSINNAALAASNAIAALRDEDWEYSSIVWSLNGTVSWTTPFTQGFPDRVNWMGGLAEVPDGAVIIGIVHNHPDDPYVTDTIPSGGSQDGIDWQSYNRLVDQTHPIDLHRPITIDPNLLLYIYSNEDHKTHVYDKTDKNQDYASCALQPH